jgi:hypothetical protein
MRLPPAGDSAQTMFSLPKQQAARGAAAMCSTAAALTLAHGALDVAHDQAVLVVQELDTDLGHLLQSISRGWERVGGSQSKCSSLPFAHRQLPPASSTTTASRPPHLTTRSSATDDLHHDGELGRRVLHTGEGKRSSDGMHRVSHSCP